MDDTTIISRKPAPEAVARHYDSPASRLASVIFGGHLHLGYWDEENRSGTYAQASATLTRKMMEKVRIGAGQRFCDFGCGVGLPAIELAREKGCFVEGVTVSGFQQEDATARAMAAGAGDRVRFTLGSVLEIPFPADSFDGGWFFESIFHMGHREALAFAHRVLKAGACLVIADLTLRPTATSDFLAHARDNILADFVPQAGYAELLKEAGFELVELDDVSAHVMPQLVPKISETIAVHQSEIAGLVGEQVMSDTVTSFRFMSENLEYVLITARKA